MSMPFYVPPEQLIKDRAEFARKGVARGRAIVAIEYADGLLLVGENASSTLHKIGEIYDGIAFAGVGRFNEFETLRVAGVRFADLKGYAYGRADVTGKSLAYAYSQTVGQIFTHEVKPYEIEVLVAEVGPEPGTNALYRVTFDGTLHDEQDFGAIGGNEEALRVRLEERFVGGLDLDAALQMVTEVIQTTEDHEVAPTDWEAAVLDRNRGRRKFRRLETDEVVSILS